MKKTSQIFRINSPAVVHETIDGEAVIVNMKNGSYYSVDGVGAVIWGLIDEQMHLEEIRSALMDQYIGEPEEIKEGLMKLVRQLLEDNLILPSQGDTPAKRPSQGALTLEGSRIPFVKPELQKYTDMEELLLLDPIHEASNDVLESENEESASEIE